MATMRPGSTGDEAATGAGTGRWTRRDRWWLLAVCAWFVLLAGVYGARTPMLETGDEAQHLAAVRHIAEGRGLPVQPPGPEERYKQEGSQPPLYYLLAAGLTAGIDQSDWPWLYRENRFARTGDAGSPDNKRMYLEVFQVTGAEVAGGVARGLNVALGVLCLVATFWLARLVVPRPWWFAAGVTGLVASVPMFVALGAGVTNDVLAVLLATVTLGVLVRLLLEGVPQGWRSRLLLGAGLGVLCGLGFLAKVSLLALLPVVVAVVLVAAWLWRDRAAGWLAGALVVAGLAVAGWVAMAGWWVWRNLALYGEPLGIETMLDIAGRRPAVLGPLELLPEFAGLRISFWGLLGGSNVLSGPAWWFVVADVVTLVAVAGLPLVLWRARRDLPRLLVWLLLLGWSLVVFAALVRWTGMTWGSLGRLLFPALPAMMVLGLAGVLAWFPARLRLPVTAGLAGALAVSAALVPLIALDPAYNARQFVREDLPGILLWVVILGGALLVSVVVIPVLVSRPAFWPGRELVRDRRRLLAWGILVGWGLLFFFGWTQWDLARPGPRLRLEAAAPLLGILALALVLVSFRGAPRRWTALVVGVGLALVVLMVPTWTRILPRYTYPHTVHVLPEGAAELDVTWDGVARLAAWRVGKPTEDGRWVPVDLYWVDMERIPFLASVFVKLETLDGVEFATRDSYPVGGLVPTTRWGWPAPLVDRHWVELPKGLPDPPVARVRVGMVDGAGFRMTGRLPNDERIAEVVPGVVRLGPSRLPADARPPQVYFGPAALLEAVVPERAVAGAPLAVVLEWRAEAVPPDGLAVFAHLVDGTGRLVAQQDTDLGGTFPARLWEAGDVARQGLAIALPGDLPAGPYRVLVGVYERASGARLGEAWQAGVVEVAGR